MNIDPTKERASFPLYLEFLTNLLFMLGTRESKDLSGPGIWRRVNHLAIKLAIIPHPSPTTKVKTWEFHKSNSSSEFSMSKEKYWTLDCLFQHLKLHSAKNYLSFLTYSVSLCRLSRFLLASIHSLNAWTKGWQIRQSLWSTMHSWTKRITNITLLYCVSKETWGFLSNFYCYNVVQDSQLSLTFAQLGRLHRHLIYLHSLVSIQVKKLIFNLLPGFVWRLWGLLAICWL